MTPHPFRIAIVVPGSPEKVAKLLGNGDEIRRKWRWFFLHPKLRRNRDLDWAFQVTGFFVPSFNLALNSASLKLLRSLAKHKINCLVTLSRDTVEFF